jgi:hypothetical protein
VIDGLVVMMDGGGVESIGLSRIEYGCRNVEYGYWRI